MLKISAASLPCDEATLRAAVQEFAAAIAAHCRTVGQPAPWPRFEVVREILADAERDFIVVHPTLEGQRPQCPGPVECYDWSEELFAWVHNAEKQAAYDRLQTIVEDPQRLDLMGRLLSATPQQLEAYVDANVVDLASARLLFKRILKVLAVVARGT